VVALVVTDGPSSQDLYSSRLHDFLKLLVGSQRHLPEEL